MLCVCDVKWGDVDGEGGKPGSGDDLKGRACTGLVFAWGIWRTSGGMQRLRVRNCVSQTWHSWVTAGLPCPSHRQAAWGTAQQGGVECWAVAAAPGGYPSPGSI